MPETKSCESYRINKLGTINDTLTRRGGLAFFVKYVDVVGVLGLLLAKFEGIKKSAKGVGIGNLFLQALYFFFDGTSRHVSYFDELKKDSGYAAVVEMHDKPELRLSGVKVTLISPGFVESNIRRVDNDGNLHVGARDPVPQWLVMSTEKAVRQILRAVALGKREAIVTAHGKALVALERFVPWVIRAAGRRMTAGRT